MRVRRVAWILLLSLLALIIVAGLGLGSLWIYLHPRIERINAVEYGQRGEQKLTLDILRPAKPNGFGIAMMVSGGWKSLKPGGFPAWVAAPLLRRGYTVFAVCHISQPRATVMEIAHDASRAMRFIRHHAADYGVDPHHLGVTGGSAGGHLSLLLATQGGPGPADASDPIDRESSAVQAVAIFYPPTDLLNLGASTENLGDGGPPKSFVKAFGPQSTNLAIWRVTGRELSPIYYVHTNQPPILIYHGDADTLVPLDQSERFQAEARKVGAVVDVVVHHGGGHGWYSMVLDVRRFADWFDRYLRE